jgi:thiamine-monophosphate kinase
MERARTIGDLGEKLLIRTVVTPLLNPEGDPDLPGDDCGVAWVGMDAAICVSTDRVPWDLTAFRIGLIDIERLGYYLAVLNLSDLAAMGAEPMGIVLNLGLPPEFPLDDLRALLRGADSACRDYCCRVLGGDLSDAEQPSIAAAVIGKVEGSRPLRRTGSQAGDLLYCSGPVGLTATAFRYFLDAKPAGLLLSREDENLLVQQFSRPKARLELGVLLRQLGERITCMDNTDGFGQTALELGQLNAVGILLDADKLPIHEVSMRVAASLSVDVYDLVLGPGADFQLIGTVPRSEAARAAELAEDVRLVGRVTENAGSVALLDAQGGERAITVIGWDYFKVGRSSGVESSTG